MTTLQTVLRQLQSCAGNHHAGVKDGQLLEQFVRLQDEAAFAALVQRHGRMVYGVCLRLLRNTHDVEDAFQATFMVLARRAAAILPRDNVANWLHGVAYRTALKARMLMARRGNQQRKFLSRTVEASTEEKIWEDVLPLLDQELANLPENYRLPIVLCDLEGNTRRDAARQLGWPEGTVAGRLARGRSLLAKRLARRGVLPCAALFSGGLLARRSAAACVPPKLIKATMQTALAYAASWPANGLVSARLAALSQGVFRTMLISQLQKTVALLLAVALVLSAAGWGARQVFAAVVTVDEHDPAEVPSALPQTQKAAPVQPAADEARQLGSTRFRHGGTVFFVAYVADGKHLITAAHDLTIRMWDAETGQEIRRFERSEEAAKATAMSMTVRTIGGAMGQTLDGLPQAAFPIAVSPDGRYLAASAGSTIQVWQVDSGKQLHALKLPAPDAGRIGFGSQVRSLAFSSDGKKLLAGLAGGPVAAWDLVSGKAEATKEAGQKTAPSGTTVVSPDGKYAAWCEINLMQQSTAIKVKDLTTGQEVANIKGAAVDGRNLTFTPDGKTLAWTQLAGIQLLEIGKDAEPRTLGKVEQRFRPIASVNFAPDGQTVALSTSQRTIELWDLKTGKLLREFGDPERDGGGPQFTIVGVGNTNIRMDDVAFSKDGKTVAAALGGNFVRQFDLATGKEIVTAEPGHRLPVGNVQLSPDGTMLTTAAARDSVRLWDLAQAKEIKKIPLTAQHGAVALSADGRRVYVAKVGTIEIWDVMTGERVGEVKAGNILIAALAVSPNGKTLAVRSAQGGAIQLWDTATGKKTGVLADQVPETGGIRRVMVGLGQASGVATAEIVFSPDGRFIAGASANRHLSLWDVSTGARLWETEVPAVDRFAFAADGRMLALLNPDGTVSLVEACTGQARGTLGQARPKVDDGMRATVFVPGGLPPTFNDARPNPHALAFSADGRYLATSHAEQSIHLWDLETGKQIDPLMGHQGGIAGLSFSADRKHLVSGSLDTTTMVWDLSRKLKPRPAADEPLDIKALAADFAGKDAAKAYDALSKLSRHPAPAVALARDLVKPVPAPDPLKLKQLLIDLNSSKFDARRQATADLEKMGDVILPALKEALKTESTLEGVQRLEMVLKKLSNPARGGGVVVELRTVELLELMGTSEARKLLESLAAGADGARLTQEARVSLERLTRRQ